MILLDTDVMVDLLREYPTAVEWVVANGSEIVLPGYVAMELVQGCKNKAEQERLERVMGTYAIAWPSLTVNLQSSTGGIVEILSQPLGRYL